MADSKFEADQAKADEFNQLYQDTTDAISSTEKRARENEAAAYEFRKFKQLLDKSKEAYRSAHGLEVKDPKNLRKNTSDFLKYVTTLKAEKSFNEEMLKKYPESEFGYQEAIDSLNKELSAFEAAEHAVVINEQPKALSSKQALILNVKHITAQRDESETPKQTLPTLFSTTSEEPVAKRTGLRR